MGLSVSQGEKKKQLGLSVPFGTTFEMNFRVVWHHPNSSQQHHLFVKPFTSKGDQFDISPAASPELIISHSIKNLAFHSILRRKMIILPILTASLIHLSLISFLNLRVKGCCLVIISFSCRWPASESWHQRVVQMVAGWQF